MVDFELPLRKQLQMLSLFAVLLFCFVVYNNVIRVSRNC